MIGTAGAAGHIVAVEGIHTVAAVAAEDKEGMGFHPEFDLIRGCTAAAWDTGPLRSFAAVGRGCSAEDEDYGRLAHMDCCSQTADVPMIDAHHGLGHSLPPGVSLRGPRHPIGGVGRLAVAGHGWPAGCSLRLGGVRLELGLGPLESLGIEAATAYEEQQVLAPGDSHPEVGGRRALREAPIARRAFAC